MTPLWTAADIAAATGGTVQGDFIADGVTFDSREVIGGELFIALKGETTDGHRFLGTAGERGAAGFLVSEPVDAPHVRVADTTAALNALGAASRARSAAKVIGVTGSVGKTGTKEALKAALARFAPDRVHASVKSYNNHTGVPLSLARMPGDSRFGVFEMGMNHEGELAALTRLVRPHVAVVTWVASAHRAYFATEEAIADAKGEIFQGLEPGGTAIVPFDNPHRDRLLAAARPHAATVLTFGEGEGADVRALRFSLQPDCTTATADVAGETLTFKIGLAGRHWLNNGLAVLAAVKAAGGDLGLAGLALADMAGLPGRGRTFRASIDGGQAVVIDESYNANPASMQAALGVLGASNAKGRKLAVLGSMRELGDLSDKFHADLAPAVIDAGVDHAILVGAETTPLADALKRRIRVEQVANADAAIQSVLRSLRSDDVLLVKGSNSVGLGRLVAHLGGSAG